MKEEGHEEEGQGKQIADIAEITKKRKKRRTLNQNERLIYAPSCNLGTLNFDYSSGYVTIPHDYVKFTRIEDVNDGEVEEGVKLIRDLQSLTRSINDRLQGENEDFQLV